MTVNKKKTIGSHVNLNKTLHADPRRPVAD